LSVPSLRRPPSSYNHPLPLPDALPILVQGPIRSCMAQMAMTDPPPDWNDLRDVLLMAEAKSLSEAARRAGVSQSTMSRRLVAIEDRKSTRLNSSHVKISYAVFCLKKKI